VVTVLSVTDDDYLAKQTWFEPPHRFILLVSLMGANLLLVISPPMHKAVPMRYRSSVWKTVVFLTRRSVAEVASNRPLTFGLGKSFNKSR
jgi:hypothetical protein